MNIIQIAGHLGADVETRVTPDGAKVSSIRVATKTRKGGRDETIWWRVTLWGDRWDKMLPYLTKGSAIIVIGELQEPKIFTNRDGHPQVNLDIRADILRFSPFGKGSTGDNQTTQTTQPYTAQTSQPSYGAAPSSNFGTASTPPQTPYGRGPTESPVGAPGHGFGDVPDEDLPF